MCCEKTPASTSKIFFKAKLDQIFGDYKTARDFIESDQKLEVCNADGSPQIQFVFYKIDVLEEINEVLNVSMCVYNEEMQQKVREVKCAFERQVIATKKYYRMKSKLEKNVEVLQDALVLVENELAVCRQTVDSLRSRFESDRYNNKIRELKDLAEQTLKENSRHFKELEETQQRINGRVSDVEKEVQEFRVSNESRGVFLTN